MKILILAETCDERSGWGAYASAMRQALRDTGQEVTVLTADPKFESSELRLPRAFAPRWQWWLARFRLRRWLCKHAVDIIHVVTEPYVKLAAAFGETPWLATVHGTYAEPAAHGGIWAQKAFLDGLRRAWMIVAVSAYTADHIPPELQSRVRVIPNGVTAGLVQEPFDPIARSGDPLILSVGALKPRKGFLQLLSGFKFVLERHPGAQLVIIGAEQDQRTKQAMDAYVRENALAPSVRYLGAVSRRALLGWYRACDVFALTPIYAGGFEGFGLVYLEAGVFGKPCVGSIESGATTALLAQVTGFLANPHDPASIASALEQALQLASDAIIRSVGQATWSQRIGSYLDAYHTMRQRSRSANH